MRVLIVSVVLTLVIGAECAAQACKRSSDYCALCSDHVACKKLPSNCSDYDDVKFIEFDKDAQDHIIFLTNDYRNAVANGSKSGFAPAAKMASPVWSCELAYLAQKNVEQCIMNHDPCRKIDGNPWVGQNLAAAGHSDKFYDLKTAVDIANSGWFKEIALCTQKIIDKYPNNGPKVGHFTQMMQDRCKSMGCAAANYFDGEFYWTLTACNYWFGNVVGQRVYKTAPKAALECTTGTHPDFKALCSTHEQYDFGGLIAA